MPKNVVHNGGKKCKKPTEKVAFQLLSGSSRTGTSFFFLLHDTEVSSLLHFVGVCASITGQYEYFGGRTLLIVVDLFRLPPSAVKDVIASELVYLCQSCS